MGRRYWALRCACPSVSPVSQSIHISASQSSQSSLPSLPSLPSQSSQSSQSSLSSQSEQSEQYQSQRGLFPPATLCVCMCAL